MIRAIIFDCFGVLYTDPRNYIFEHTSREKHQELQDVFKQSDYGFISSAEFTERAAELVGVTPAEFSDMCQQRYVRNDKLFALLPRYRRGYKVGLLSNVGDSLIKQLFSEKELSELFDDVVLSSAVGMIKPNGEIFELAAQRLDVAPSECIMIDDIAANIEGAQGVGMQGIVYASHDQCQHELLRLGVESA